MTDAIDSALILSEEELTVLLGIRKQQFVGYKISDDSLSIDKRYMGINSLVRRKILYRDEREYHIADNYRCLIKTLINSNRYYVISGGNGIVYCADESALVRRIEAAPVRYSLNKVNVESLVKLFADEALIPEADEYGFLSKYIPSGEDLKKVLLEYENDSFSISEFGGKRRILVARIGLCMSCVKVEDNNILCEVYSKQIFTKMLSDLIKGVG